MKKRFLVFVFVVCLVTSLFANSGMSVLAEQEDYVAIFGDFINQRNDYNTKLEDFLQDNYHVCDFAFFKDCYMVDMNNDSVPELLCIFCEEWGPDEYAVLIEYDGGFKLGAEIPFNYNSGSAGSEFYRVLKADGNFYYEKYTSTRYSDGRISQESSSNEIILNKNGSETVVYSAQLNGYTDFETGIQNYDAYVNGQKVDEIDYEYTTNNFKVVADGYNYGETWNGYKPQFGKDYAKFWDEQNELQNAIKVLLNGNKITFDQQPIAIDGRTMVPLRAIFETLGATVEWDGDTQTVTSTKGNTVISMTIGKKEMYKNGKETVLDVAPVAVGGRTLVPVRAVAEAFDCMVDWDNESKTVIITTAERTPADKEWVYNVHTFQDSYYDVAGNLNTFRYDIPAFNIESADADFVNAQIYSDIYKVYEETLTYKNDKASLWVPQILNKHYVNGDVVSLCIETHTDFDYVAVKTYNMNITDGKLLTNSQLISQCGYTESEYIKKIKEIVASYYVEMWKNCTQDEYYWNRYAYTISDEVCNINTPAFVGENGNIFIVASIGSNAGAEAYEHIIDTGIEY